MPATLSGILCSVFNARRVRIVLLAAAAYSSGCMKVGPDYVQPPSASSPNWLEAGDKRINTAAGNFSQWWLLFNDATLSKLIEIAYRQNLSLQVAGVRVLEARAQLGIARGEMYPQMQQVFGTLQSVRLSEASPQAPLIKAFDFSQSQIGLGASWEIDFWGKYRRAIESADANLRASVADYDNVLVSLTSDLANAYITIRTTEKRLSIARLNTKIQKESLRIAQARVSYGTTSERDVEQAKNILGSTQATIPTLEVLLRQTKNALCFLLGMPPNNLNKILTGTSNIPAPPPQVIIGIPADLLRRRPDIRSAELQAESQSARIGVAKAYLFPAFSLTGSFGFLASDAGTFSLSDMFQWRSRTGTIGPSVQWNIFNYGQITNLVRVQDARFQELLITYQNAVLKAQQEVEDNLIAFLKAQDRAQFLGESTAAALRSKDLALLQYETGTADFTTVLTSQQALLTAQDNLAATLGDISRSLVSVYRTLGGGWQIREGRDWIPDSMRKAMARRTDWGGLLKPTEISVIPAKSRALISWPDW